jgi:ABC-type transporter Mla subunit MlaD
MSRRALIGVTIFVVVVVGFFVMRSGGGDDGYQVRAIFRNAAFTIAGEDVKVAGAKVGEIQSLDVTADGRAAVVLNITDPGFQDFRSDAECAIRLQSVIGEKLVDCQPTQPRPEGTPPPPPLKEIPNGLPGAGQRLLPAKNTVTPVDVDLINDIQRLPYRQRLTIFLNEFGTGLAGRGEDLRQLLRDADPALRELDKVIKVLASQNRTLRDLAVDGDRVVTAWAKKRKETANFIVQANTVAQATAERGDDLERNFEKFPAFLEQLKPTMVRLGALSDEMLPVVTDLGAQGSDVSRFLIDLGPFARNSVPAFRTLGQTADIGGPALEVARPLVQLIAQFASKSRNISLNLRNLAVSLKDTDTIQRAMDVIYFAALGTNGFDSFGHYFRTTLLSDCTAYRTKQVPNSPCNARFSGGVTATSADAGASAAQGVSPLAQVLRSKPQPGESQPTPRSSPPAGGQQGGQPSPAAPTDQTAPTAAPAASKRRPRSQRSREALLNYLLGSDSK